jgi:hypothetical protein
LAISSPTPLNPAKFPAAFPDPDLSDSDPEDSAFSEVLSSAMSRAPRAAGPCACLCATEGERYHSFEAPEPAALLRRRRRRLAFSLGAVLLAALFLLAISVEENSSSEAPDTGGDPASPPTDLEALKASSYIPPGDFSSVVASDTPLCSSLGVTVMDAEGLAGNAFDAAVATALCLGVVDLVSSGIGGGGFILAHEASSAVTSFIDAREYAPTGASADMFEGMPASASTDGALAVAVPGELRGLEVLWRARGIVPWAELVRPARDLARDGFVVAPFLEKEIAKFYGKIQSLDEGLAELLTGPSGRPLVAGEVLKRPKLADTLTAVMDGGADAFYEGPLAASMVAELRAGGSSVTEADWGGYEAELREPVQATVDGFTIVGAPPPSSGGATVIAAARFLAAFDTPAAANPATLGKHRLSEAMKCVPQRAPASERKGRKEQWALRPG